MHKQNFLAGSFFFLKNCSNKTDKKEQTEMKQGREQMNKNASKRFTGMKEHQQKRRSIGREG